MTQPAVGSSAAGTAEPTTKPTLTQIAAVLIALKLLSEDDVEDESAVRAALAKFLDGIRALVRAHAATQNRATKAAVKAVVARAEAMSDDDWYDSGAITKFAKDAVRVVEPYQRQMAATTNAFQARVLTQLTGKTATPVKQTDVKQLRGIPHEAVYGRVADEYRYQKSKGKTATEAKKLVKQRAEELADMDITLAVRKQESDFVKAKKPVLYYRRVIHPELSQSGTSCGLCIVASHRIYNKAELRPIHFRCNCITLPVTDRAMDVGDLINDDDLTDLYKAAGGNTAAKLKNTRFAVHEHGELGPVLTYKGDRWRSPSQVREDTDRDKPTP